MADYKCENCKWSGDKLTERSKLPSGVIQMAGCCPVCGETIVKEGEAPEDALRPKPKKPIKR